MAFNILFVDKKKNEKEIIVTWVPNSDFSILGKDNEVGVFIWQIF
jgi:hypothetical protein